ncbi:sensor histidine kinase [Bradyrhizobium sp.]|uniref:sensor histidine kinase n=1 Tax=Bradyrhizobium sp. TaxID=376 RepID=UPI003C4963C2
MLEAAAHWRPFSFCEGWEWTDPTVKKPLSQKTGWPRGIGESPGGIDVKPPPYTFDPDRLDALSRLAIVDTPPERGFDDVVELAVQICQAPVALVSLVSSDRQWFKARSGFEACETDLDSSVCAFALVEPDVLVIADLAQDARTRNNPLVRGEPHIRFYAGAPLRTAEGHVIGSLCVIDDKPRPEGLTESQSGALKSLARQVMAQLELRRAIVARDHALAAQEAQTVRRKASEARYKTLFDAIDDGFCIVEMKFRDEQAVDYRFVEINPAFARQTGLTDAQGRWMREMVPQHEQYWFDVYGRVASTGEAVRFEYQAKGLDDRWFNVHAFRIGRSDAPLVAILFSDESARKQAELDRLGAEDQQRVLNHELSHRMKNTMSLVQAVASQTLKSVPDQTPVKAFSERVLALSVAHDLLLQRNWTAAEFQDVAETVVATFGDAARFDISGPKVTLGSRATLSLSLLLHELTTNAFKYGALSNATGRVTIAWDVSDHKTEPELSLKWDERGGPDVVEPTRKGFGSRLLRIGLVGTGGVQLRYHSTGFEAEFTAGLADLQA